MNWCVLSQANKIGTTYLFSICEYISRVLLKFKEDKYFPKMSEMPETYITGFHDENAVRKMKYKVLGKTGLKVSELSLGTGGFSSFYGNYSLQSCKDTVRKALKSGINLIDTAPWYGHGVAEEVLGLCLEDIPRKAYYLATKVGRYEKDPKLMFDFSAEKTRKSIDESLKRLKVDYMDLIQIHDIEFAPKLDYIINETLPALEEAVRLGKAKHIGITGYPVSTLKDFVEKTGNKVETILSYCRFSLVDNMLDEYLPFFLRNNIGVINASVHAMGLLTNKGPQAWHPAYQDIKDICRKAGKYCEENGVELGRLALYYSLKKPGPHTHLAGSKTVNSLDRNLDVVFNGISPKELQVLGYLKERVFPKLVRRHWEGVEIAQRKRILGETN